MAREARKLSSKGLYYIELKGDRLFYDDEDRAHFVELIEKYFSDGGKIYAYLLKENRIYMAVKESEKGISMTMKPITVSYARYFNKRHGGEGSIFSDRFKSIAYESLKELKAAAEDLEKVREEKTREEKESSKETVKNKKTKKQPVKKTEKKAVQKKVSTKKDIEKKEEKKAVEIQPKAQEEKKTEVPKRKNRSLPSWLL